MIIWNIYCVFSLMTAANGEEETQYECGAHGRFEYCIDGIPGCIIGCHCHPGYYFDTDTKICEPNAKLTQQFRRSYMTEPTRAQYNPYSLPDVTIPPPTPTTTDPISRKVDEITKDADDLGDWLYNQFFKTIENQVINNTNVNLKTRRSSDGGSLKKKSKKKPSRKYWQRSSKKKGKKQGLRRKLLRITEDDSLFDSTSSSDEDSSYETDSSYSSSASSESGKHDKDHGHKKFIFFNKAPKPALPSFIFLPGMDTPFYPPIGLPPPPVIPMYPIVPVPPMGPIFSHPVFIHKSTDESNKNTSSPSTTSSSSTTEYNSTPSTSSTSKTTVTNEDNSSLNSETTPAVDIDSDAIPPSIRNRVNNKKRSKLKNNSQLPGINSAGRKKLMNKLQKKMKRKKTKNPSYDEELLEQMQEVGEPVLDYGQEEPPPFSNQLRPRHKQQKIHNRFEDVDFRYLSQLIHRADSNNSNLKPTMPNSFNDKMLSPLNAPLTRRFQKAYFDQDSDTSEHHRNLQKPADESYYSNLGREIASLIRKIDIKGERQVNIEIEPGGSTPVHPIIFDESSFPHNLWERYARSPMSYVSTFYNNGADHYKASNENLLNLENKVEIFATTTPSLSLNELENIISTMKNPKTPMTKSHVKDNDLSNNSFNMNLLSETKLNTIELPKRQRFENYKYKASKFEKHVLQVRDRHSFTDIIDTSPRDDLTHNTPNDQLLNINVNNIKKLANWLYVQNRTEPNILSKIKNKFKNIQSKRMPQVINDKNRYVTPTTTIKPKLNISPYKHTMFGNIKYFTNNKQRYVVEHAAVPFHLYSTPAKINTFRENYVRPSYFHHVINHYDFFDQA